MISDRFRLLLGVVFAATVAIMKTPPRTKTATNWHPEDVKAAVRKAGGTLRGLAFAAGVDPSLFSHSLLVPRRTANHAIAQLLGLPVQEIWPEWFDSDGQLKPGAWKSNSPRGGRQRQKGAAA